MDQSLRRDIQQTRPFTSLEEEVFLSVLRTGETLLHPVAALFREKELSNAQYNVLRILRGAGRQGLSCNEIVERMVTRDPDMTRLLDGLQRRELVTRERSEIDRRVVLARISRKGEKVLAALDRPLARLHLEQLGHLGKKDLRRLCDLLERARERPAPE